MKKKNYKIPWLEIPLIPIVAWNEEPLKDPIKVLEQRKMKNNDKM